MMEAFVAEVENKHNELIGCFLCIDANIIKKDKKIVHYCNRKKQTISEVLFLSHMINDEQKKRPDWCPRYT